MFQSGSIGKLFTAFAALREGAGTARYECRDTDLQGPLFMKKGWPKPVHDHGGDQPHGSPDLVQAIAVSCIVYFAQPGLALGPDPLRALHEVGLEVGYGGAIEPGAPGTRQLASTAFGQGIMVMNTMQAARMVAAIASGSFQKVTFFGAFFRFAALFWHTIFNEDAEFSQCVVDIPSDLPKTADRQTNFSWAIFKGNTAFTLCNFSTPVYFWRTIFQGNVSFDYTHFHEETIWGGKQTDIHSVEPVK